MTKNYSNGDCVDYALLAEEAYKEDLEIKNYHLGTLAEERGPVGEVSGIERSIINAKQAMLDDKLAWIDIKIQKLKDAEEVTE